MRVGAQQEVTILSTNVPEDDAPIYDPDAEYAKDQMVIVPATHRVYQALKTTTGEYPPDHLTDDDPPWSDLGATNQRKCVDEFVGTQTEHPILIDQTIDISRRDSLALFLAQGRTMTLDQYVEETLVQSRTFKVLKPVFTYKDYFFRTPEYAKSFFLPVLARANSTLRIRIDAGEGGTAKLGNIVPVLSAPLGSTRWGVELGILSFSKKVTTDLGISFLKKGANANTVKFTANIDNVYVDYVNSTLRELDGTPALYVVHNENGYEPESLVNYGFFNEFVITIPGPVKSTVEFTINNLI